MLETSPSLRLDVERGPDWLLVKVSHLDQEAADFVPLANSLWKIMQQHLTYRLVLELDRVEVLNSHLIGQLVQLYKRIREHDGVMRLCGLSPHNREVIETCRLDDRFLPYVDRKSAVMAGSAPVRPR